MTLPGPCSASQVARRAAMVVVLPLPAGPTSRSTSRPDVATPSTATAWSSDTRPATTVATIAVGTVGAPVWLPASSSRASASMIAAVVYTSCPVARNRDVPSGRRNSSGV